MYTLEEHSQVKQNRGCYQSTETTSLFSPRTRYTVNSVTFLYKSKDISTLYLSSQEAYPVLKRLSLWTFCQAYMKTQRLQILVVEIGVLLTKVGSKCGTKCNHIKL